MTQSNDKIKGIEELAEILASLRASNRKVVHCHGVFDLQHIGHIRHFQQAKKLGDILLVTVTPDKYVNKGPHRPAFTEDWRAEAIAALGCVDYVAINKWPTAVEVIKLLKPDIYAKGKGDQGRQHNSGNNYSFHIENISWFCSPRSRIDSTVGNKTADLSEDPRQALGLSFFEGCPCKNVS